MNPSFGNMYRLITVFLYFVFFQNVQSRLRSNLEDWINITPKSPGQPWPLPQSMITGTNIYSIDARAFSFQYAETSQTCDILTNAFNRYYKIIFLPQNYDIIENKNFVKKVKTNKKPKTENLFDGNLKRLVVNVQQPCEDYPNLDSDESCKIKSCFMNRQKFIISNLKIHFK